MKAQLTTIQREYRISQQKILQQVSELQHKLDRENDAHKETQRFFKSKMQSLDQTLRNWQNKYDIDVTNAKVKHKGNISQMRHILLETLCDVWDCGAHGCYLPFFQKQIKFLKQKNVKTPQTT